MNFCIGRSELANITGMILWEAEFVYYLIYIFNYLIEGLFLTIQYANLYN